MKNKRILRVKLPFLAVSVVSAAVHIAFSVSQSFAANWRMTVGAFLRAVLAHITSPIPVSLTEAAIISSPAILVYIIAAGIHKSGSVKRFFVRTAAFVFATVSVVYSVFVLSYGAGFYTRDIGLEFGIVRRDVSVDELYSATLAAIREVNREAEMIDTSVTGATHMNMTFDELSEKVCSGYDSLAEKYSFPTKLHVRLKPITLSEPMTYTHLSGVYSMFTGEANINVNYPDFVVAYTSAHEMAHQRGIAREDEANFVAFLVCDSSVDHYLRYSGYLNVYEYMASALYSASPQKYSEAVSELCDTARTELRAYSEFFDKYRENTAANVTDSVNSAYLSAFTGNDTRSYGMVVDLCTLYLNGV